MVELTRQDNATSTQLARAIQADPALVARLIKLANASGTPGDRPILAIKDAIGKLGLNAVRGLALGFSLMKVDPARRCLSFNYSAFWSRNLACAVAMQALTASSRLMQSDEAFSLGLLSHIGELGLASLFPQEYSRLLESTLLSTDTLLLRERQAFEFDHADLSVAMLGDWGFPVHLVESVRLQEQAQSDQLAVETRSERLLLTLMLAANIATICMTQSEKRSTLMSGLLLLGGKLSFGTADLMALCDGVVREWTDWCRLLEVPSQVLPSFVQLMNVMKGLHLESSSGSDGNAPQKSLQVLVIDDNPNIRTFLKQVLTQAGYACVGAENGRQGLDLARSEQPDMVIVDWILPPIDGAEFIRNLRESQHGRAIYILLLTSLDQDEQLVDAIAAGADDFLTKPLRPQALLGRLLAGRKLIALHQKIARHQIDLQSFATEFAKLNERLQESREKDAAGQERMEMAVHGGNIGLWDFHLPSKTVVLSERGCSLLGYRLEEIDQHLDAWRRLAHPEDWSSMRAALQRHISGETTTYECEHRFKHRAGHWVWILDRGQVAERDAHGGVLRVVGTHMDISDRKAAELAAQSMALKLQQDEARSRDFSLSASDWFWETDSQHCFCYFSDNFEKVYGLPPARLLGKSRKEILELDALNPRADVKAHLDKLESHEPFKNFEYQIRIDENEIQWVSVSGLVHVNAQGRFAGYRGTGTIITDRKRNDEKLREATREAQAADLAKSRFLATMSHEIRTPMNGVLGMAQLLLMPKLTEAERCDYARTILSSGQTLLALLNDILDLSKIEAGKFQLDSTAFAPEALLHETCNLFAGAAQAKGLQLGYLWQGAPQQRYLADSHRLRQMLSNLVGNAIKFTARGKVGIEAKEIGRTDAHVALLEFSVRDSGIGIAPEKIGVLFKPFSQADSSTTREFGGSGLGLSIVRQLAKAMGGDVGVVSEPGRGSNFWFRIRAQAVADGQDSRSTDRAVSQQIQGTYSARLRGHLLVAEDNPINAMVIKALLGKLGLSVTLVNDGQRAVDAVVQGGVEPYPDVILMDLHMPVLDGYGATERIRQWETTTGQPRRPIIALTADAFEEDRLRCLAAGMDDFLTKPVAIDALKKTLTQWLPQETSRIDK